MADLIAVTPYGYGDASNRARVLHWLRRTSIRSQTFVTGSPIDPRGIAQALRVARSNHGPLLLARHAHPLGQGFPESVLLRSGNPGIYDIDDGLPFDNGRLPEHGRWWKPLVAKSRIATSAAQNADRVIAGNERIAEWAVTLCDDVVVIPTCVEPDDYELKRVYGSDKPAIGWIGSPATEPHLFGIANALLGAWRESRFRLEIVSSGNSPIPEAIAPFTRRIPWTLLQQHSVLRTWEIGLMPLPDRLYEQSKCAYKLLQYGAAALPMIGSPVGASSVFLKKADAPSPRSDAEWTSAIVELLRDENSRRSLAARGHRVVRTEYSFEAWESRWRAAVGAPS